MNPSVVRTLLLSLLVTLSFGCASSSQDKAAPEPAAKAKPSAEQASQQEPAVQDDTADATDRLVGTWQGPLKVPGAELTIVFNLDRAAVPAENVPTAEGSEWAATMDSPDQGATGIPVATVSLDDDHVRLEVPNIGGVYEGTLAADTARIEGKWTQGGASLPLDVERVDASQAKKAAKGVSRPQMPEPPYPYAVEEVEFEGGEPTAGTKDAVTLAGTLTLPKADGPHPAVILVTG